jgi:hypothetical protein
MVVAIIACCLGQAFEYEVVAETEEQLIERKTPENRYKYPSQHPFTAEMMGVDLRSFLLLIHHA